MKSPSISQLAIPAASLLIAFLSYSSQLLFLFIEPEPLTPKQTLLFNVAVSSIWITYIRACRTDPGRVPTNWQPLIGNEKGEHDETGDISSRQRWCRKCQARKPPRAHHCKTCGRCIPKMDHHCPWTNNCVSHFTLPHFVRFLLYAVFAMTYLEYFLYIRATVVWKERDLPSYLGPSAPQLAQLFVLIIANSMTLFAVGTLFIRTVWNLAVNTTTIEGWEIERHETLLRRARVLGGHLDGPDGMRIKMRKQEFPYDIGIWRNLKQGMGGSGNILGWFWPLAATPPPTSGFTFEVNEFEDPSVSWPPPDPDRIPRKIAPLDPGIAFTHRRALSPQQEKEAFRQRQQEDLRRRWDGAIDGAYRRQPFHKRCDTDDGGDAVDALDSPAAGSDEGEEGWRDSDGDRLRDFGVDEDVEFYDEDDVPLGELIRRRRNGALV